MYTVLLSCVSAYERTRARAPELTDHVALARMLKVDERLPVVLKQVIQSP